MIYRHVILYDNKININQYYYVFHYYLMFMKFYQLDNKGFSLSEYETIRLYYIYSCYYCLVFFHLIFKYQKT